MIYSVDFIDMCKNINYLELCKYLTDLNWVKFERKNPLIKVFQKKTRDTLYQVTVPCSKSLEDYSNAIYEVIKVLAVTENKSEERLIQELLNPMSDIVRIRAINNSVQNGSIGFEDAIKLFDNAKKLLTFSVLDVVNPKVIHRGKKPESIKQFIDKCKYGQTEIGSYVISLICPFSQINNGINTQLSIFSDEEQLAISTTRKATKKLMESAVKIKKKIDNGENLEELVDDDSNLISIDFIEALSNLGIDSDKSCVEISTKWAPTVTQNKSEISEIAFTNNYYEPMKAVVEKFKNEEKEILTEVIGKISTCKASPSVENRKKGEIEVISLDLNDKIVKTKACLDIDSYDIALKAHHEGKTIKLLGEAEGNLLVNCTIKIL